MGAFRRALAAAALVFCLTASSASSQPSSANTRVLTYRSPEALRTLLARTHLRVKRNLPALHAVEVAGSTVGARTVVRRPATEPASSEPAVRDQYWVGRPHEWQYTATPRDLAPE